MAVKIRLTRMGSKKKPFYSSQHPFKRRRIEEIPRFKIL